MQKGRQEDDKAKKEPGMKLEDFDKECSECSHAEETDSDKREKIGNPRCFGKLVKFPCIDIKPYQ